VLVTSAAKMSSRAIVAGPASLIRSAKACSSRAEIGRDAVRGRRTRFLGGQWQLRQRERISGGLHQQSPAHDRRESRRPQIEQGRRLV
jgi:hypothetical protein